MKSALVLGGRFKVYEDGTVNKYFDGVETPATLTPTGRGKKYLIVTYTSNGNQRRAYVHRLIATAFIPNPDHLPQVNHIDGDPRNNRISNLEWCTAQRNVEHAFETGLTIPNIYGEECKVCGALTVADGGICPACKRKIISERNSRMTREARSERYKQVNIDRCSATERIYVKEAIKGLSIPEIADMYGVTKQCVGSALVNAERKTVFGRKVPKTVQDERVRLLKRVDRLKKKYESAEAKMLQAKEEYESAVRANDSHEKMIAENYDE